MPVHLCICVQSIDCNSQIAEDGASLVANAHSAIANGDFGDRVDNPCSSSKLLVLFTKSSFVYICYGRIVNCWPDYKPVGLLLSQLARFKAG